MSAITINLLMRRKQTSDGAKIAPFDILRVIAMRKLHTRHVVDETFPQGAEFQEWEWVLIGDEKELKIVWDGEFREMQAHYDVIGG